jgi:serine/threonine-protein kinase HipA
MPPLTLDVWLDGFSAPVASLSKGERGNISFIYKPEYVEAQNALPISMSLPVRKEAYGEPIARPFFDNLLPESDTALTTLMDRERIERSDVVRLLQCLGRDCPGAISILDVGAPPVKVPGEYGKDYREIGDKSLLRIVTALHQRRPLPREASDPSPLAGFQGKIAVTILPNGTIAEPIPGSGSPTTHILKVPDEHHVDDPIYESATLALARSLGLEAALANVEEINGIKFLLIKRFDRAQDSDGRIVRVHQEDFLQALGLPAFLKYERRGQKNGRFDISGIHKVLQNTRSPADDVQKFIRSVLFDLMTGNVDGHAKNYALLYDIGERPSFAPRYDLLPTRLDPTLTDQLPFRIGSATRIEEITIEEFDNFLAALGMTATTARLIRRDYTSEIAEKLSEKLEELAANGLKRFADLIAGNIRMITSEFRLETPKTAKDRDVFLQSGGGWQMS